MNLSEWIIGPQLVGFIFGVAGLMQIYFPPNKINGLDIYLTSSAEKNEQILAEARRFFPRCLFKLGSVVFIVGIIITAILKISHISPQFREVFGYMFLVITSPLIMIVIVKTNNHLEKKFNSK